MLTSTKNSQGVTLLLQFSTGVGLQYLLGSLGHVHWSNSDEPFKLSDVLQALLPLCNVESLEIESAISQEGAESVSKIDPDLETELKILIQGPVQSTMSSPSIKPSSIMLRLSNAVNSSKKTWILRK